ncbi:MAG: cytochrome b/b6 domain-containing protein [Planctomycetota bacterium]
MARLVAKHPRVIRWSHWVNVPLLFIMIWSGLLIYWADGTYALRLGDVVVLTFFPDSFYSVLGLEAQLARGMAWHFFFMWFFLMNGLVYVGYTALSGEWRDLLPNRRTPRQALQVVLHDLKLRRVPPEQDGKFNGAQRLAYTGVLLMGAGSIVTGLAIWKPTQLAWLTTLLGGYQAARVEHFALMIGYVLFFVIHIAQVIRAGWNNFRAMAIGYELQEEPKVGSPP